jgi:hypothetical protein
VGTIRHEQDVVGPVNGQGVQIALEELEQRLRPLEMAID